MGRRTRVDGRRLASFFLRATFRNSTGAKARARQLVNIVRTKVAKVNICPVVTIRKTCFRFLLAHPRRHPTGANDWNFEDKLYREKSAPTKRDIRDANFAIEYDPKRNVRQLVVMRNVYVNSAPFCRRPRYPCVAPGRNITADNSIRSLSLVKYLLLWRSSPAVVGTSKTNKRFSRNGAL